MTQDLLEQFIRLFTLEDAAATARMSRPLQLALEAPAAYQAQFGEELAGRGIGGELTAQQLRDVALLDGLWNEELVWESDLADPASVMADGLNEVLTRQNRPARLPDALRSGGKAGAEQLDALQAALEPLGLALVLLTPDYDAYPLSVVADAQADDARRLARELGFNLTVY
jgi:hypothetical protein